MSISYNKSVPVVFLVQEGDELPREATAEDFLKAGYVPADGRGYVKSPEDEETEGEGCGGSCEGCCDFSEGHDPIFLDLSSLPNVAGIFDPFKIFAEENGLSYKRYTSDLLNDNTLFNPLWEEEKVKPAKEEKTSPVEEFAGDLFKGAFNIFNTVKGGLADLLEPIDYSESAKSSTEEAKVASEPTQEKPEFTEFEQTIIDKFEEMGLGSDAKSAMRKSKEFSDFLSSKAPTPEQAKAFAEMLKNGKPPFFG